MRSVRGEQAVFVFQQDFFYVCVLGVHVAMAGVLTEVLGVTHWVNNTVHVCVSDCCNNTAAHDAAKSAVC